MLQRIGTVQLDAVLGWEAHVGQHVGLGVEQLADHIRHADVAVTLDPLAHAQLFGWAGVKQ